MMMRAACLIGPSILGDGGINLLIDSNHAPAPHILLLLRLALCWAVAGAAHHWNTGSAG
jgi:hypothetical protein